MEYNCNGRQMYILLHTLSAAVFFFFLLKCFLKHPFLLLRCSLSPTEHGLGNFRLLNVP